MAYPVEPPHERVEEQLNKAWDQINEGGTNWPAMSYEQGVAAALDWITGNNEDLPMEDE